MDIRILDEIEPLKARLAEIKESISEFVDLYWREIEERKGNFNYVEDVYFDYSTRELGVTVDDSFRGDISKTYFKIPIEFIVDSVKFIKEHKEKLIIERQKKKIAADKEIKNKELAKLKELKEKYEKQS